MENNRKDFLREVHLSAEYHYKLLQWKYKNNFYQKKFLSHEITGYLIIKKKNYL